MLEFPVMYSKRNSNNRNNSFKSRPRSGGFNRNPGNRYRQKYWSVTELESVLENLSKRPVQDIEEIYTPKHTFETFEINKTLKRNIVSKGYTTPTPIQDKVIPIIINGRDVLGIANTGTGKTAAFLIPLIELVARDRNKKVLILSPTRELALQIYEEFRAFSKDTGIYTASIIGGANIERQKWELSKNPSFVIATPGRLKDLLKQNAIKLDKFNTVVLDETDQMVDIGFITDIKHFIELLPTKRQSLFFSATISPKVEEVLQAFVKDPVVVSVKKQDTASNVEQKIIRVPRGTGKIETLHKLLIQEEFCKVLVFGTTKHDVQKLSDALEQRGLRSGAIHGNKRQSQRQLVLKKFKNNEIQVLLATDVASRGLDIKDVSHVINYDMPENYDAYIHRIGRTGRANKKGIALTLVEDRR